MINLPGTEKVLVSSEVLASLIQSLAACIGFLTLPPGIVTMAEISKQKDFTCFLNPDSNLLASIFIQSAQYSSLLVTAL